MRARTLTGALVRQFVEAHAHARVPMSKMLRVALAEDFPAVARPLPGTTHVPCLPEFLRLMECVHVRTVAGCTAPYANLLACLHRAGKSE